MSASDHLHDLQGKAPAASLEGKKGGRGVLGWTPPLPFRTRSGSPGPGNPPSELSRPTRGDAPPSPPTSLLAPGRREGGYGNRFQGGEGAPYPPPAPAHPPPGFWPPSGSLPPRHRYRWESALDPDADADQGTGRGRRRRRRGLGSLWRTRGLATPPSAAQLTVAPASSPPPGNFPGPARRRPHPNARPSAGCAPRQAAPPAGPAPTLFPACLVGQPTASLLAPQFSQGPDPDAG